MALPEDLERAIIRAGQLFLGTANGGLGTEVTATAAELNALDGITSTAAELNILDGVTATAAELNMAADSSANCEVVTGANVITAAESGKTFFLNAATGFASTLPTPALGLRFKFVIKATPTSGNHTVVTAGGVNIIDGMADVNSTLVLASDEDSINFIANTAISGDWVEVISDGDAYYVSGQSGAAGGITFTAT